MKPQGVLLITVSALIGWGPYANAQEGCSAFSQKDPFWQVQVSSEYMDEGKPKDREKPFFGAGTVVEIDGKLFVLTASHLTQGKNLEIKLGSRVLKAVPGDRLTDNLRDIDLIRLEASPCVHPLAVYSKDKFERGNGYFISMKYPQGSTLRKQHEGALKLFRKNSIQINANPDERLSIPDRVAKKPHGWNSKLVPADRGLWGDRGDDDGRKLYLSASGTSYFVDIGIVGGVSGAPYLGVQYLNLFDAFRTADGGSDPLMWLKSGESTQNDSIIIRGLALSYQRDFEGSHLATADQLAHLADRFITGDRGQIGKTKWKVRNGLLYRDLGDGTLEINPSVRQAGGGGDGQGGGGGDSQGGGGGDGQGGDGQGGDGYVHGDSASDAWEKYVIDGGMTWKGAPALAFRTSWVDNGRPGPVFSANLDSLMYLDQRAKYLNFEPVKPEELGKLIRVKATQSAGMSAHIAQADRWFSCRVVMTSNPKDGVHLEFKMQSKSGGIDHVVLRLNEKGIPDQSHTTAFRPIVSAVGLPSKSNYRIDLTGLYSVDPAAIRGNSVTGSSDTVPSDDQIQKYAQHLYIMAKGPLDSRDRPISCLSRIVPNLTPCCEKPSASPPVLNSGNLPSQLGEIIKGMNH